MFLIYNLLNYINKIKFTLILTHCIIIIFSIYFEEKSYSNSNETYIVKHKKKKKKKKKIKKSTNINNNSYYKVYSLFGHGTISKHNMNYSISSVPYLFKWKHSLFETDNLDSLEIIDPDNNLLFLLPSTKFLILNSHKNDTIHPARLESGYLRVKLNKNEKLLKIKTNELEISINNDTDLALIRDNKKNRFFTRVIVFSGESIVKINNKSSNNKIKLTATSNFKIYEDGSYELNNNIESTLIENFSAWTLTRINLNKNLSMSNDFLKNKAEEINSKNKEEKPLNKENNSKNKKDKPLNKENNSKNKKDKPLNKENNSKNKEDNSIDKETKSINKNTSLYLIADAGYTRYNIFDKNFAGYNLGLKALFINENSSTPINLVYGVGTQLQHVTNNTNVNNSDEDYRSSSSFMTVAIGADLGIRYVLNSKFTNLFLTSLYISPFTRYVYSISNSSYSYNFTPTVNSNWNISLSYHGLYNINKNISFGAGLYAAQGYIDYNGAESNGYIIQGKYGSYYFFNADISLVYYFPIN